MKVILLQDVAKIGRRHELAEVPDGYALNKLIPQRLAQPATPQNVKRVEMMSAKQAATDAGVNQAYSEAVEKLKGQTIEVKVEANDDGTMFEALKPGMVVEAVSQSLGLQLEASWLQLVKPIKSTGEHTVLMSHGDLQGEFTINVVNKK